METMTPETQIGLILVAKKYLLVCFSATAGALAHALEKVKTMGWKGWVSFFSDMFVCIFFGTVFAQLTVLTGHADYQVIATSLGSYWGAKSFEYAKLWLLNSLKANIKQ